MKKGQINMIIAAGMALMVLLALGGLSMYTSNLGMSTNIRNKILSTMQKNERNRQLISEERNYVLDQALLLTGIRGGYGGDSPCGYMNTSENFLFLPTINGKINYWRKNEKFCIPTEDKIRGEVKRRLDEYFSNVVPRNMGVEIPIKSDFTLRLDKEGKEYAGQMSKPMLDNVYNVTYFCTTGEEVNDCDVPNRRVEFQHKNMKKVVNLTNRITLENLPIKLQNLKTFLIPLGAKKENSVTGGEVAVGCEEINGDKATFFVNESKNYFHYWFNVYPEDSCYQSIGDSVVKLAKLSKTEDLTSSDKKIVIGDVGENYTAVLITVDENGIHQIRLEPFSYKILQMKREREGKRYIHFVAKDKKFRVPDAKIMGSTKGQGIVDYRFVPSDSAEVCSTIPAGKFHAEACSGLLTGAKRRRSLPLLYGYSKDFINGSYGGFRGWHNFALNNWLRNQVDVINMKTLKVFTGEKDKRGNVEPKWGWKYNLINNLGLLNTGYTWDHVDKCCKERNVEGYIIEFCSREYCPPDVEMNPILNDTMIANFKTYFKQLEIAQLNTLTNVYWNIGIKSFNISVRQTCLDQEFSTSYKSDYKYKEPGKNATIGLPEQLRFGYQDKVKIRPDHSELLCKANEYWGNHTGDPCVADLDVADCIKSASIKYEGETGVNLSCTQYNKCCPPGYDEQLKSQGGKSLPCCKLMSYKNTCSQMPFGYRKLNYSCYDRNAIETDNYLIKESCQESQGPYGGIEWINLL